MRVKRSYRKKLNFDNEKENSNANKDNEKLNLPVVIENSTSSEINNSSDNNLITNNEYLPTNEEFDKILSSYSADNEHDNIDVLLGVDSNVIDLSFSSTQGQKLPLEDQTNEVEHNKRFESSNDTIVNDILNLKQKNIELEARIKTLEEQRMQFSSNVVKDQNFEEVSNISRDDQENNPIIIKKPMSDIFLILNMDANKLANCNQKTATGTARSIIKCMYPDCDSNSRYSDVDKSVVNAIIEYTKLSNPNDNSSGTERRRAISNYFAYLTHKRKLRMIMASNQVISEHKKDNSNTTSSC